MGQNVEDFQTGRTMTLETFGVEDIFFQEAISFPIGGKTKMHLLDQSTEKASMAKEPGYMYREKNRSHRAFEVEAKGSKVNPCGKKWDWRTEKEALSIPQSSL